MRSWSVNWAKSIDLKTGRPIENPEKRTSSSKNTKDICPSAMGGKNQQPVSLLAAHRALLRADQQPLHGLRRRRGEVPGRPAVRRRHRRQQGGPRWQPRRVHRVGSHRRSKKVWGIKEAAVGVGRRARRPVATSCSTARWKAGSRRVHAKTGEVLWKFKTPSGIIGNPMTYTRPGRQAVRRRAVGRRRLVRHWRRGRDGPRRSDGRPRRHRRVRRPGRTSATRVAC